MPQRFSNNGSALLAQDLLATQTLAVVQAGFGGRFPTTDDDTDYFIVVIDDGVGNIEIARCTLRTGDSMVLIRGQEGTTPLAFPAGSRMGVRMTAGTMVRFIEPDHAVFFGDVDLNSNALINGEILNTPVRGEKGVISNELVVPPGGARPTIGGTDILLVTDSPLVAGMIFMWSGSAGDIPAGWFLCDGTNGTPNLSGRFIASYAVGDPNFDPVNNQGGSFTKDVGGAHDHGAVTGDETLDADDIPSLTINTDLGTSTNSSDNHNVLTRAAAGRSPSTLVASDAVIDYDNPTPTPHNHAVPADSGHTHDQIPVYYTLAFIQFSGVAISPIFTGVFADQAYDEGETIATIDMKLQFNEGNGTSPTYSATGLPPGLSITATGPNRGEITGTVDADAASGSPYSPQVTLTTSLGSAVSNVANWTVADTLPLSGYSIWLHPDTFDVTTSPGFIEGWANDPSALQGASGDMLRLGNTMPVATYNGLTVGRSLNTSPRFFTPSVAINYVNPITIFGVGQFEGSNNGSVLFDSNVNTASLRAILGLQDAVGSLIEIDAVNVATLASEAEIPGAGPAHVFAARLEVSNYRARISGGAWQTPAGLSAQNYQYGKFLQDATSLIQAIGWVGEFLLYDFALSDAEMDSVFDQLVAKWIKQQGTPSTIVSWLAGTGSPIIVGPQYTANGAVDAAVNDPIASQIPDVVTSTVQEYAEFEVLNPGIRVTADIIFFGWKQYQPFNNLANTGLGNGVGIYYFETGGGWAIQVNPGGSTSFNFDDQQPFTINTVVGVALDALNNRVYAHINGVWQTSNGGTQGGVPGVGPGWPINTAAAWGITLFSSTRTDSGSIMARDPEFTPVGFTPVT